MAGLHRLSGEGDRESSVLPLRRASKLNFGLIFMILLATLAIVVTLMFPEIQFSPADLIGQ
jgi:hypothetical protein